MTTVVSHFAACYAFKWKDFFPAEVPMQRPPSFDARHVGREREKEVQWKKRKKKCRLHCFVTYSAS